MQNEKIYKHYVFLDRFNKIVESNLLKFSNIIIIIDINQNDNKSLKEQSLIIDFLKKYKIPFLIKNDYQKCQKYKADGIFIESIICSTTSGASPKDGSSKRSNLGRETKARLIANI